VSNAGKFRLAGPLAVLGLAVATLPAALGQVQHPVRSHVEGGLALAAETTVRDGLHAKLPPHLSTLLGLSKEQECQVLQNVVRTEAGVRGFDVSVANKKDIVLFAVDEAAKNQSLYLTSPTGTLRKVVSVKAGVGEVTQIKDKDREEFQKEKQFWLDRMAPSAAAR